MGGHAFKNLYCPRINLDVYCKAKAKATTALQTVFTHVVVPTEMPEKNDYGDVDFLVCSPLHFQRTHTINDFPWEETVQLIKDVFKTTHGRRGYLTNDCMYFAVDAPCDGEDYFIQIDVKVCFKPKLFEWYTFELGYASSSKIIGSMVKPLGLTIDPEGIHIRVEDVEETDHNGSMVWISKDPKDVLRIAGLDFRILNAGFSTKEEIYKYFASSWLFNPAHFAARLAEENYQDRLEERSAPWTHFIMKWVPEHYPGYRFAIGSPDTVKSETSSEENNPQDLQAWYKHTRSALCDKVFTMFPNTAEQYYTKRAAHLKKLEEQRIAGLIMNAIPIDTEGWETAIASVTLTFKPTPLTPPGLESTSSHETPQPPLDLATPIITYTNTPSSAQPTTIHLPPLPRLHLIPFSPRPPPPSMSIEAKLACLTRWTHFDLSTGTPYMLCTPRPKEESMYWTDAIYAGAREEVLLRWAKEEWWQVWARQGVVNYVGMWKGRFEKKAKRAGKEGAEERGDERLRNVKERLEVVNRKLGFLMG